MCFNWKVLAGLGAAGVALYLVRPDLVVSALPLLLLAACPLSMLFMGKGMMGRQPAQAGAAAGRYTCPMHPDVAADKPGACPTCGMALIAAAQPERATAAQAAETARPAAASAGLTRDEELAQLRAQMQRLSVQQSAVARQLEALETTEPPSKAVAEAEQVARAADARR